MPSCMFSIINGQIVRDAPFTKLKNYEKQLTFYQYLSFPDSVYCPKKPCAKTIGNEKSFDKIA